MSLFLVTLKLPKTLKHDPHNKVAGVCQHYLNAHCTDVTGEHHTVVVAAADQAQILDYFSAYHITRIEEAGEVINIT